MPALIAIIIPVHNSLEYTCRCLDGLLPLTKEASSDGWQFEVVVVDDGSTDGTAPWVREKHPQVHLLDGDGKLWWSGAINKGMQYALSTLCADYVLWWNNDIYPATDYFIRLTALLENTDNATVYGSKIYMAERPSTIWAFGGFFHRLWGYSYLFGQGDPDSDRFSQPLQAHWLPGMGTLLSRAAILKIGDLNQQDFPQYHGDIDFTIRARLAGCLVVVLPSLRIWNHTAHSGHLDSTQRNNGLAFLGNIRSQDHWHKEWMIYRKYVRNPLAYLLLLKKYVGLVFKEALKGARSQ